MAPGTILILLVLGIIAIVALQFAIRWVQNR
jgi:hypothetical protein